MFSHSTCRTLSLSVQNGSRSHYYVYYYWIKRSNHTNVLLVILMSRADWNGAEAIMNPETVLWCCWVQWEPFSRNCLNRAEYSWLWFHGFNPFLLAVGPFASDPPTCSERKDQSFYWTCSLWNFIYFQPICLQLISLCEKSQNILDASSDLM